MNRDKTCSGKNNNYSNAVKAVATLVLLSKAALRFSSASRRDFNSVFIVGDAIKQTNTPSIEPARRDSHIGIPRITALAAPAINQIPITMPRGFSTIFSSVVMP